MLQRRKWIVVFTTLAFPLVALAFSLQQQPRYEASADVLLNRGSRAQAATDTIDPTLFLDPVRATATQARLARLPTIAFRTLRATGSRGLTADDLLRVSTVAPDPEADLLQFVVTDESRERAVALANEYARQYTIYRRESDTRALKKALSDVDGRLALLRRAGRTDSDLYKSLQEKELRLSELQALQTPAVVPLRKAINADQIQPRPVRTAVLAGMAGVFLGVAFAFLWNALDTRLRTAADIAAALQLPLLGRIAEPRRKLRTHGRLAMLEEPEGADAEAFRILATSVVFANLDLGARTLMVTSSVAEEGKSTTAANLAVAFAHTGKRVVLADFDLRRPVLAQYFGLEGRPGLTDVVLGNVGLADALAPIPVAEESYAPAGEHTNGSRATAGLLRVLPTGPLPPNPVAFIESRALLELLSTLRGAADLVLLDTTPLLHVGDAMALSAKVDGVVVIARLNVARRPMTTEVRRLLSASPAPVLGCIVTGAQQEEGYGYAGYYPYPTRTTREKVPR